MTRIHRVLFLIAVLIAACGFAPAPNSPQDSSASKVKLYVVSDRSQVEPGSKLRVAVLLDHEPYWHTYAHDSPAAVEQGMITVDLNVAADHTRLTVYTDRIGWPPFHSVEFDYGGPPMTLDVYEGRAIFHIPIIVKGDASPGLVEIPVTAHVQACDDKTCLAPAELRGSVTVSVVPSGLGDAAGSNPEIFANFPEAVWADLEVTAVPIKPGVKDPTSIIVIVAIAGAALIVAYVWFKFAR